MDQVLQKQLLKISANVTRGFSFLLGMHSVHKSSLSLFESEDEVLAVDLNVLRDAIQFLEFAQAEMCEIVDSDETISVAGVAEIKLTDILISNAIICEHLALATRVHSLARGRRVYSALVGLIRVIDYLKPIAEDTQKLKAFIAELSEILE